MAVPAGAFRWQSTSSARRNLVPGGPHLVAATGPDDRNSAPRLLVVAGRTRSSS
jgi:hypothetical protein